MFGKGINDSISVSIWDNCDLPVTEFPLHHTHSELSKTLDESVLYHYKIILINRSLEGIKKLMFYVSKLHTNLCSVRFEVLTTDTMKNIVYVMVSKLGTSIFRVE
jgi:hypothetical protein